MSSQRREFFDKGGFDQGEKLPYPNHRYTKYFWLINLQKPCYTKVQAEWLCKLLKRAVLEVFTQGDIVAFAHANHMWDRRFIGANELNLAIEIGPKTGKIHCHLIQEIKHRSIINIDPQDVKDAIDRVLSAYTDGRVTGVFVGRTRHPSSKPLEEYIDKDNVDWRNDPSIAKCVWAYTLRAGPGDTSWKTYRERLEEGEPVSMEVSVPKAPKLKVPRIPVITPQAASSSSGPEFFRSITPGKAKKV